MTATECVQARELALEVVSGVCWSATPLGLNLNLVAWNPGEGVESHVNHAVDVVMVVLEGRGTLTTDGDVHELTAGSVVVVPRGTSRSIKAETRLVYVSVHAARSPLMPAPAGK